MSGGRITLERFDGDAKNTIEESADYKRGFADGEQKGDASRAALQAESIQAIASTLADMAFGFEEARLHVIKRLQPILAQVAEAALPHIIHNTFGAHLTDVIDAQVKEAATAPIEIAVAPDIVPVIADATQNRPFTFVADPTLRAGQALIQNGETLVLLDLPALLTTLQTALHGLECPERSQSNG